jgi:hypothetical protein
VSAGEGGDHDADVPGGSLCRCSDQIVQLFRCHFRRTWPMHLEARALKYL